MLIPGYTIVREIQRGRRRALTGGPAEATEPRPRGYQGAVSYLDTRAVGLLRRLTGGPLKLVNCSPLIEELLAVDAIYDRRH